MCLKHFFRHRSIYLGLRSRYTCVEILLLLHMCIRIGLAAYKEHSRRVQFSTLPIHRHSSLGISHLHNSKCKSGKYGRGDFCHCSNEGYTLTNF